MHTWDEARGRVSAGMSGSSAQWVMPGKGLGKAACLHPPSLELVTCLDLSQGFDKPTLMFGGSPGRKVRRFPVWTYAWNVYELACQRLTRRVYFLAGVLLHSAIHCGKALFPWWTNMLSDIPCDSSVHPSTEQVIICTQLMFLKLLRAGPGTLSPSQLTRWYWLEDNGIAQ